MKFEFFIQLFERLAMVYPKKARKLLRLYVVLASCEYPEFIPDAEKDLEKNAFNMFYQFLSRSSRDRLISDNHVINEESFLIERKENDGWTIGTKGISRYELDNNNNYVRKSFIPRKYFEGFGVNEEILKDLPEEERKKVIDFYMRNLNKLTKISLAMDDKQELITYGYEIGNPNVDTRLMESFISFLGFERLTEEDINSKAVYTKMAK